LPEDDTALCAAWVADAGTCLTLLRVVAAAAPSGTASEALLLERAPLDPSPFETLASLLPWNASAAAEAYARLGNHGTAEVLRLAARRENTVAIEVTRVSSGQRGGDQRDSGQRSGSPSLRNTAVLRLGPELQLRINIA
jgi:hypothetical protein